MGVPAADKRDSEESDTKVRWLLESVLVGKWRTVVSTGRSGKELALARRLGRGLDDCQH